MATRKKTPSVRSGGSPNQPSTGTVVSANDPASGFGSNFPSADPKYAVPITALLGDPDAYSHLLGVLGFNKLGTDNQLLQQILSLASGNLGKSGSAYGDLQKLLVEMALKNLTSQEQRDYDKSALDEQRLYDNPQNQLARLMGAGISRDAAIQMLQGGSDPALVGSGSDASLPSQLPSPTERLMQQLQTASGFISAVSGLVSLGFTIPQAVMQTRLMSNQSFLSDAQKKSYVAANKAYHILHSAGAAADVFGSIASVTGEMKRLADGGNTDASQFIASPSYRDLVDNAPYSSGYIGEIYKMERSSADYAREFDLRTGNMESQRNLTEVSTSKMLVEMTAIQDQVDNIHAQTDYYHNLSALTGSQKTAQDMQNRLNASWQTKEGLAAYADATIEGFRVDYTRLCQENNPELWKQHFDTLMKNEQYAALSYDLGMLYYSGEISSYNSLNPENQALLGLCRSMKDNGYFDYIETKINANTKGNVKAGPFSFSNSALGLGSPSLEMFNHPLNPNDPFGLQ